MQTEQNKEFTSVLPIGRQLFSHLQESRASSCLMVPWEDKCHHSEHTPFFSLLYMLSMSGMVWNIPLVRWGQLSWLYPPPSFLCTLSLLASGVG